MTIQVTRYFSDILSVFFWNIPVTPGGGLNTDMITVFYGCICFNIFYAEIIAVTIPTASMIAVIMFMEGNSFICIWQYTFCRH